MLDKKKIKEKLEEERDVLLSELQDMGKFDEETGEWQATPEELSSPQADPNDMADRFEDFESKSAMIDTLGPRLNNILKAIKHLNSASFGKCKICKEDIEEKRLEANPAARTCMKHLEEA